MLLCCERYSFMAFFYAQRLYSPAQKGNRMNMSGASREEELEKGVLEQLREEFSSISAVFKRKVDYNNGTNF